MAQEPGYGWVLQDGLLVEPFVSYQAEPARVYLVDCRLGDLVFGEGAAGAEKEGLLA